VADLQANENLRISLNLPEGSTAYLNEAARAVKTEYQASVRWKKLRCRNVIPLPSSGGEDIFILEVGQSIEFDWTWEGSTAFTTFDPASFSGSDYEEQSSAWSGEVVQVDEIKGHVYVWADAKRPPTEGWFFIRPFAFLAALQAIYAESSCETLRKMLPERLKACLGEVHPRASSSPVQGLPDFWQHSWGVMWGPPGTGKTFQIGQQIALCLNDPSERTLVVSTTNKATDEAALSIGKAVRNSHGNLLQDGRLLRVGKGARLEAYEQTGLTALLTAGASASLFGAVKADLIRQRDELKQALDAAHTHEEKAQINQKIKLLERQLADEAALVFASQEFRVVVATAFKATSLIASPTFASGIAAGIAPFTTVIIDEAGLISRAATAALSLLASRRVLIVGDSKQLAPISKMSRILPSSNARWLASSALIHLQSLDTSNNTDVHLLRTQYRMHPQVSRVVSAYQYENLLVDAEDVRVRQFAMPALLDRQPRCIWYVLDDDADKLASVRAERGPGNRSWIRRITENILAKLSSDPSIREKRGLFLSPFKAQADHIAHVLASKGWNSWSAATIHSQQGAEADFVIFDTVNAGSCAWPDDEWQRLVNVGLSRARQFVLFLASRAEMQQPFLAPLIKLMAPRILLGNGQWKDIQITQWSVPAAIKDDPTRLGYQIAKRKQLRPVLSSEQQRLCERRMDGKPRLVRGVAGSGKTVILAHWLCTVLRQFKSDPDAKIWVVYANHSLAPLLQKLVQEAWQEATPGELKKKVEYWHIKLLIDHLMELAQIRYDYELNYDAAAQRLLQKNGHWEAYGLGCDAMFVDEGQDMGPNTFKLLNKLIRDDRTEDGGLCISIFYDNAQNIYGRSTPKWKDLGLDMQGRSTIMKESFRSTKPITELALNVLYQLQPPVDEDHKELVRLGLIEPEEWAGSQWWNVHFNQVDGPVPTFRRCSSVKEEVKRVAEQLVVWIKHEGVTPSDICILYVGKAMEKEIERTLAPELKALGANLAIQRGERFTDDSRAVIATTPHSFKGYDKEIVIIAGVDAFAEPDRARTLYVAMTRARSLLAVYGWNRPLPEVQSLFSTVEKCLARLTNPPSIEQMPEKSGAGADGSTGLLLQG
jgi:superfamily I DNA/RNA helicase